MVMLGSYLPEREARAERAYLESYRTEYTRLYEPGRVARERLLYWSGLAHRSGKAAREAELRRVTTCPSIRITANASPGNDAPRQGLGGQV